MVLLFETDSPYIHNMMTCMQECIDATVSEIELFPDLYTNVVPRIGYFVQCGYILFLDLIFKWTSFDFFV